MVFRVMMAAALLVGLRRLKQGPIQLGRPRYAFLVIALLLLDTLLVTVAPPGTEFFGVLGTVLIIAVWGRDLLKADLSNVSSRVIGLAAVAGFLLALPLIVAVLALHLPIEWPGLLTLVVVGVFNPVYEELLNRRLFIPLLQGWLSPTIAVAVSAAVFAIGHIPEQIQQGGLTLAFLVFAFLYGILSGTIMVRTGSFVPSAAMHVVYNLLVEWLGR